MQTRHQSIKMVNKNNFMVTLIQYGCCCVLFAAVLFSGQCACYVVCETDAGSHRVTSSTSGKFVVNGNQRQQLLSRPQHPPPMVGINHVVTMENYWNFAKPSSLIYRPRLDDLGPFLASNNQQQRTPQQQSYISPWHPVPHWPHQHHQSPISSRWYSRPSASPSSITRRQHHQFVLYYVSPPLVSSSQHHWPAHYQYYSRPTTTTTTTTTTTSTGSNNRLFPSSMNSVQHPSSGHNKQPPCHHHQAATPSQHQFQEHNHNTGAISSNAGHGNSLLLTDRPLVVGSNIINDATSSDEQGSSFHSTQQQISGVQTTSAISNSSLSQLSPAITSSAAAAAAASAAPNSITNNNNKQQPAAGAAAAAAAVSISSADINPPMNNNAVEQKTRTTSTSNRTTDVAASSQQHEDGPAGPLVLKDSCGYQDVDLTCGLSSRVCLTEYPWLALLYASSRTNDRRGIITDEIACSGALVHPEYVLAAGHCTKNLVKVRFGENDLNTEQDCTSGAVRVCTSHRDVKPAEILRNGSIALIRLAERVPQDVATPICLPSAEEDTTSIGGVRGPRLGLMAGWGRTAESGLTSDDSPAARRTYRLQAKTRVWNCSDVVPAGAAAGAWQPTSDELCAEDKRSSSFPEECIVDSGAPLMLAPQVGDDGRFFLLGLDKGLQTACSPIDGERRRFHDVRKWANWVQSIVPPHA